MFTTRKTALSISALMAMAVGASAEQPTQPPPTPQPPPEITTTTTTSTTHGRAPLDMNTDTNSKPDITGTSGHPDATVRIKPAGSLAAAMANFAVRTGIEIRPNANAEVIVQTVRPDSPATRAGVEAGDIIAKINSNEVTTIGSFQKLLMNQPLRPAFLIEFKRGDKSFRVPLGRQLAFLGMTIFPDQADRPVVKEVDRSSPAERAGFKSGDVITGVAREDTPTMDRLLDFGVPFIRNMAEGQGIPFIVARTGKQVHLSVTRPSDADLPMLSADQERHLRRLANGDEDRRLTPSQRPVTRTTSVTKRRRGQNQNNQVAASATTPGVGGFGGVIGGFGNLGMGLPAGAVNGTSGTNAFGALSNVNAAVAVLFGTPGNLNQSSLNQAQQAGAANGTNPNAGLLSAGVVGFVQVQANVPFNNGNGTGNGIGTGIGNINPSAPGANPLTGNTTTNTGVNPVTGNAATSTQNPGAAAMSPAQMQQQQQAQQQQGVNQGSGTSQSLSPGLQQGTSQSLSPGLQQALGANATGINGTTNGVNGTNGLNGTNGVNGLNGTNGVNNGVNGNGTTPTQSFVSARIAGIPAGTYTLAVNQFGDCGDMAGASPGPPALTLGTITVNANGQGTLPSQTINFPPQAFLGRVVSLVPATGGGTLALPQGIQQQQNAQSAVQSNANIVACGVFGASNPNRPFLGGGDNSGFGGGFQGSGGIGTTVTPGVTGTGTGTGTDTTPGTGIGTNPSGQLPTLPGQLPRPRFP